MLIGYLYEFGITFMICLIGSATRQFFKSNKAKNKSKIDIREITFSTVFAAAVMLACMNYIDFNFPVYVVVSLIVGMWGKPIIGFLLNDRNVITFLKNFAKQLADPIIKAFLNAASDTAKSKKKNTKNKVEDKEVSSDEEKQNGAG